MLWIKYISPGCKSIQCNCFDWLRITVTSRITANNVTPAPLSLDIFFSLNCNNFLHCFLDLIKIGDDIADGETAKTRISRRHWKLSSICYIIINLWSNKAWVQVQVLRTQEWAYGTKTTKKNNNNNSDIYIYIKKKQQTNLGFDISTLSYFSYALGWPEADVCSLVLAFFLYQETFEEVNGLGL